MNDAALTDHGAPDVINQAFGISYNIPSAFLIQRCTCDALSQDGCPSKNKEGKSRRTDALQEKHFC